MMALNIAVPLTTVADLMDGFGLLSPIPLSVDCRGVLASAATTTPGSHGKQKQLVSPVGSESSGVSSLDSDEIKKPTSPPSTPTEEVDEEAPQPASSPLPPPPELLSPAKALPVESVTIVPESTTAVDTGSSSSPSSSSSSARSSLSSSSSDNLDEAAATTAILVEEPTLCEPMVFLGGRNVLDLYDNLTAPNHFRLQFAQLPENDNIHFFLDNRSQYHRLGANGHIQEYALLKCKGCDFRYAVNEASLTNNTSGSSSSSGQPVAPTPTPTQTPPQHQWNGFTANNYNSIANTTTTTRDKIGLNGLNAAVANAFNNNKSFGGSSGNNNNNSNSQYFSNNTNNMSSGLTAGLFGRDSNRNNNFLNNQKPYQQQQAAFTGGLNNKFSYGNFQQQQTFPRNGRHMRYNNNNNNNSANPNPNQSSGSPSYNAVAAAAALINQQNLMQNFTAFNNAKNNSLNNANNNNMFAYYKTMM